MNSIEFIEIRNELGLTQKEFAEQLGVDRRTVVNYEQGKLIPDSKILLIELLLQLKRKESVSLTSSNQENNCKEQIENLKREILELKDHIKTLKELIAEKSLIVDFFKSENLRLKEENDRLKLN